MIDGLCRQEGSDPIHSGSKQPVRQAEGNRTKTIKIVLADDQELPRQAFRELLDRADGLRVVGEVADGASALRLARELEPDIVLMDVMLPGLNGIEATRRLAAEVPDVRVLAVSMHGDRQFVQAMLAAGATGYLLKENAAEELVAAVRTVAGGGSHTSRELGWTGGEPGALP